MESQPNPCPHNFEGLIRLLATYQKLLTVLSGTQCSHFLEVRAIRCTLVCNMPQFAELLAESIAQLLWSIHLDARRFFSAPLSQDSTLLKSQFKYTSSGWLDTGSVKTIVGCPIDRLLGLPSAPATALPGPPAGAMADWMTAAPPEHHNNTVHPFLAAAVLPACNKKASIKMTDLINATTLPGALQRHQAWGSRQLPRLDHPWEMCQPAVHILPSGVRHHLRCPRPRGSAPPPTRNQCLCHLLKREGLMSHYETPFHTGSDNGRANSLWPLSQCSTPFQTSSTTGRNSSL
jgi:hypothetical protein